MAKGMSTRSENLWRLRKMKNSTSSLHFIPNSSAALREPMKKLAMAHTALAVGGSKLPSWVLLVLPAQQGLEGMKW